MAKHLYTLVAMDEPKSTEESDSKVTEARICYICKEKKTVTMVTLPGYTAICSLCRLRKKYPVTASDYKNDIRCHTAGCDRSGCTKMFHMVKLCQSCNIITFDT